MENPLLSIIIIDYNASAYLKKCLQSITQQALDFNCEIIVVDNASKENHLAEYEKIDSRVRTFQSDKNLGFGGGNNFGVEHAHSQYLLLLNPDILIIDDSIQKMIDFIQRHQEIGALTCLMGPTKDTLQENFFGQFQSLASLTFRRYKQQKVALSQEFFYSDIVTGAALMVKKETYDKVGGFDERFFMYLEDDDLCKRLVDAGYKNAVLNTARIIHFEGKTSTTREKKKLYYKSQDLYWQKHNGVIPTLLMKLIRWPYLLLKA